MKNRIEARFVTIRVLVLLLTAHCTLPSAHAAWSKQRSPSFAWLHSVFFIDQNRGWAAGSKGTLLSTTDGGRTWKAQPQPTEDSIREVYFTDALNGLLVCERNIYDLRANDEPRAYLLKTDDGGASWKHANLRGATVDSRIMKAIFNRGGRGWAFGEGGVVYTTDDLGANWIRWQSPTRFLLLGGHFIDDNNGWLVGAGSTILQTSNGGETWHHSRVAATNVRFNATSFVNLREGWAVGTGGSIYRTVNGGRSWQRQNSGVPSDLMDIKFVDPNEGWASGADGVLLHTRNGGFSWNLETSGTSHTLERIFLLDRTHVWVVGFGGTILSYGGEVRQPRLRY